MIPILTLRRIAETGLCRSVPPGFKAILTVLLAVVGIAPRSPAAEVMQIGFENHADPLSFEQPDGTLAGFAADLARAVAHEMGFTIRPIVGPWNEVLDRFRAGEVEVLANVAYTRERDAFADFATTHLTMVGAVFTRHGDRSIRQPSDLAESRVAVQRDSFSHEYLRARGWDHRLIFVRDFHEALLALAEGRCEAVAAARIIGNHAIRKYGLKTVAASNIVLSDYTLELHMAVHAGDAVRLATLNEGLARIRANGTYDRIYEKWIGPLDSRPLRLSDLKPVLLPCLAVALAVAVTIWWQRRLLRKLAEQAERLRSSEERLRHVLEGSEDGFWDWNLVTGRIERSERWASMLGYSLDEIPATLEAGAALVHHEDRATYDAWQARLNTQTTDRCDIEYRMKTKSGEWRWILDRGKVVARAPDGRPLRMSGTHTDITTRKQTEAALIESQALLKRSAQLLEQSQATARVGGWESDLRTGRVYWTEETYRIHETTPAEFYPTRESIYSFYPPESRQVLIAAAERAIHDGTPFNLEIELVTKKQRRITVQTAGVAEKENGHVVKLYGSFRDITAERAADLDREKLRLKMLEAQKLESLGVLAGGIAHDFNNLLTVILANATFLRGDRGGNDERLAHIEAAARRAADLCRQMLAYAGKGSFLVECVDVGALVTDTADLIHVSISKKAHLELNLAPHLPPVDADASQLRQVVMNLVINASEALGDTTGTIRITTRLARPEDLETAAVHSFDLRAGDCVCLEVADTGHGMAPATLARIFDPFFTTKFTGRGLGLAAVLGIVRAHQGALTVDSAPGRGSSFRLYLPVSTRTAANGPIAAKLPSAPAGSGHGTILLADDESIVLETADALLRHHGFTTVLAHDGHEAVTRFRENPTGFLAVLVDLTMPGLDGAEVLRVIRVINPTMPVLVMSGFSEQDVLARLRGFNRVGIVRKPFTRDTLLAQIAEVTAR